MAEPDAEVSTVENGSLVLAEEPPLDQHPVAVYLARLAPGSRRAIAGALEIVADILTGGRCDARRLDWSALRYQHTQAVRAALAERYKPATANRDVAAVRGVLKEAWRLGQMSSEDYHRAVDLEPVRGETLPAGRALSAGELRALFAACRDDDSPGGDRDAALIAVCYGAGLRRAEVTALEMADYDQETGALAIRSGKGNKARIAYATNGGRTALDAWLAVRGTEPGALFCPVTKGGRVEIRRMTEEAVWAILQRRGAQAGVAHFSPHDLRRTFISDLLDAGADITAVQHLAGHSSVQTTARYDRRGEAAKRKAAELLHVPFAAR